MLAIMQNLKIERDPSGDVSIGFGCFWKNWMSHYQELGYLGLELSDLIAENSTDGWSLSDWVADFHLKSSDVKITVRGWVR